MPRAASAVVALALLALPAAALAPGAPLPALALAPDEVPDEVVVGFEGGIPQAAELWARRHGGEVVLRNDAVHYLTVRLADAEAAERFLALAHGRGDVRYAVRDTLFRTHFTPNDPLFASQWAPPTMSLPEFWDLTMASHAVKVAILDTGVKTNHVDLVGNLCGPHASFVPGEPTVEDEHGHGTHTSGIAAAGLNNGVGIAGASNACILHGKVLSREGFGQGSWIGAGITWAADQGARVISMSLGGGSHPAMGDAVKYAYNVKDALVIASAGNSGCNPANNPLLRLGYPAEYDEVMGVGALDPPDGNKVAGYSTCGLDMEISAPGTSVLSTWITGGYAALSGTSMAAPYVAGSAALVFAAAPSLKAADVRCLLDLTANDVTGTLPGRDPMAGWGRVNPVGAVLMYNNFAFAGLFGHFQELCKAGAPAIMH